MKKIFLPMLLPLVLAACSGSAKYIMTNSFNASDISWASKSGENIIKGSALIRQKGGGVITCAGEKVHLTPVSAYSDERMLALYGNNEKGYIANQYLHGGVEEGPKEYYKASIESVCDAQGFFEFRNIADGSYYVTTVIEWVATSDIWKEGGPLMERVSVNDGQIKSIVLSP